MSVYVQRVAMYCALGCVVSCRPEAPTTATGGGNGGDTGGAGTTDSAQTSTSDVSSTGDTTLSSSTFAADSGGSEDSASTSTSTGVDPEVETGRAEHEDVSLDVVGMTAGRIYALSGRVPTSEGLVQSMLAFSAEDGTRVEPFGTDLIDPGTVRFVAADDGLFVSDGPTGSTDSPPPRLARYSLEAGEEELVISRSDEGVLLDLAAWDGVLHTLVREDASESAVGAIYSYSALDGSPVAAPEVASLTNVNTGRMAAFPEGLLLSAARGGPTSTSIRIYDHATGDGLFNRRVEPGANTNDPVRPVVSAGFPVAQTGSNRVYVAADDPLQKEQAHQLEGFSQLSTIETDGFLLYFAGSSTAPGNPWRIEVREPETFSLAEDFGNGGVLEGEPDPSVVTQVIGVFARDPYLHVVSRSIDLTGDSTQAIIERRRLSDGSL